MTVTSEPRTPSGSPLPFAGDTSGPVTVAEGIELAMSGHHSGSVEVAGELIIDGRLTGALTVATLGRVVVTGDVEGPVDVRVAGTLVIEPSGRVAGPIVNNGSVTNLGWRSGRVEGRIPDDREGSTVAEQQHGTGRYPELPPR
jgi:cytoskeletal protein CcmA (bactofilin family)